LLSSSFVRHEEETTTRRLEAAHRRNTFPRKDHLANMRNVTQALASLAVNYGTSSSIVSRNVAVETRRINNRHREIGCTPMTSTRNTTGSRGIRFLASLTRATRNSFPAITGLL
jgi:hypothetical protein